MNGFSVEASRNGDEVLLAARGELDLAATEAVESELREAEESGAQTMVFDLAEVDFIDSSGLRVLLGAAERAKQDGRRFVVARPSGQVDRVLKMTGSESLLEIVAALPSPFGQV